MVFKLIRVDSEEPSKIELLVGKHVIGRGKLHIDGSDKRVSRNHAELEVTDDFIALKSLHQNPCFFIKKTSINKEILEQNQTTYLSNSDKFGLLPDNFWYEVVYCINNGEPEKETHVAMYRHNVQNEVETIKVKTEKADQNELTRTICNSDEAINFEEKEEIEEISRSESPSLLIPTVGAPSEPAPSSPNKRGHDSGSSSPADLKRVKIEPAPQGIQNVQAGPSNDQATTNDTKDINPNTAGPTSPLKPSGQLRERCLYGANCYRRNPQHKAAYSHPSDSDWGTGDLGVCPYGHLCQKKDPRHWQQNEHPPGVNPPDSNFRRPGQDRNRRRKKRQTSESDDDDGTRTNGLIVTGKRNRRTIQPLTGWVDNSQSDEDNDPYQTDDSDEWEPDSQLTNSDSQY